MTSDFRAALRPALTLLIAFTLLLGLAYPLAITGVAQVAFPSQANGSLVRDGDKVAGSALIGQDFTSPRYFHGRRSAAGKGYDAMASGGSNLGPTSMALVERIAATEKSGSNVPPDLLTASASGLDPHISPEAAFYQVDRVAAARGLPAARVRELVQGSIEGPMLGVLGEARVNVLMLNRQLDRVSPQAAR